MPIDARQLQETDLLLESCSFITERALSCRTLVDTTGSPMHSDDTLSLIQKEQELADWLDRNIVEYRATLSRRLRSETTTESTRQQLRLRQQELLDESVRKQQEQLLLSRIEMSSIVQDTVFPQPSGDRSEREASEALLVQEATKSRDAQATKSLDKIKQLNDMRARIQDSAQECLRLQRRNRSLWQQLGSDTMSESRNGSAETSRVATETVILKRVVQDIAVGSDLDWYTNKRLRKMMAKLEG